MSLPEVLATAPVEARDGREGGAGRRPLGRATAIKHERECSSAIIVYAAINVCERAAANAAAQSSTKQSEISRQERRKKRRRQR